MEKSVIDETIAILVERQKDTRAELQKRFKRTKPVGMETVSDGELIEQYDRMTPEDMDELIQTEGRTNVEKMIREMEDLKRKRDDSGYPFERRSNYG